MTDGRVRGLVALVAALAWYAWGAPGATAALDTLRPPPRGQLTLADVAAADLPRAARPLVAEAERLAAREEAWGHVVAALLTPDERSRGLTLAGAAPPVLAAPGATLEPEMPVLVDAILARYGPATLPAPPPPAYEGWPMVDRRTRARVLLALVNGPGLDEERAAIVLGATLDLLEAQSRRTAIEAELAAMREADP